MEIRYVVAKEADMGLDVLIRGIIEAIPSGSFFDSHTVILKILQENHDEYLKDSSHFTSTELYHAHIGKIICNILSRLLYCRLN
jgi:hypothetical protein